LILDDAIYFVAVDKSAGELNEIFSDKNCSVQPDGSNSEVQYSKPDDIACDEGSDDTECQNNIEGREKGVDLQGLSSW
jgi:hypothetical protein